MDPKTLPVPLSAEELANLLLGLTALARGGLADLDSVRAVSRLADRLSAAGQLLTAPATPAPPLV